MELVRAGLWEKEARLSQFGKADYEAVMRLAEEQSVMGLVTAGLEHLDVGGMEDDVRCKPSQEDMLQFIGQQLETREPFYSKARYTLDVNLLDTYEKISISVKKIRKLLNI